MKHKRKYELFFEDVPFKPFKNRVRGSLVKDIRREFWFGVINLIYKKLSVVFHRLSGFNKKIISRFKKWYRKPRKHLKIEIHLTWTKVFILCLLGAVWWPNQQQVIAEPLPIPELKRYEAIDPLIIDEQPKVEYLPIIESEPVTTAYNVPDCNGYGGAAEELINRESRCDPYAQNPFSGACGIAQELPCGKSGCTWGDGNCQLRWMESYVVERYGSWENALAFHDRNGWY